MPLERRLFKSRTEKMIDGVCGGIAVYLQVDPTFVRVAWILLVFMGGAGILLYLVAMVIMPTERVGSPQASSRTTARLPANSFWGILLMVIGFLLILHNLGVHFWGFWWGVSWETILAVSLIVVGGMLLFGANRSRPRSEVQPGDEAHKEGEQDSPAAPSVGRLKRSRGDRKLLGVCGGIASYAKVDSTIVRLLFVLGAFASVGLFVLGYIILGIVVPSEPAAQAEPAVQPS